MRISCPFLLPLVLLLGGCAPSIKAIYFEPPATQRDIRVVRAAQTLPVKEGMKLQSGDVIETGPGASVHVNFPGRGSAFVLESSRVEIGSIWVWLGEIFVSGQLETKTEHFTAGVKGTKYAVSVDERQARVTVYEGSVQIADPDGGRTYRTLSTLEEVTITSAGGGRPLELSPVRAIKPEDLNRRLEGFRKSGLTLVPDLRGLTLAAAEEVVVRSGMSLTKVERRAVAPSMRDRVVDQRPAPAAASNAVTLIVGIGGVQVPDVQGLLPRAAISVLRDAGFSVRVGEKRQTGRALEGRVAQQTPAAGTWLAPGGTVTIIEEGDPEVAVPNLVGQAPEQALGTLKALNLRGQRKDRPQVGVTSVRVVGQQPPSGAMVALQTVVVLDVALPGVRVPDISRRTPEEALRSLKQAGLRGRLMLGREPFNGDPSGYFIAGQSPRAGTIVERGGVVEVALDRVI